MLKKEYFSREAVNTILAVFAVFVSGASAYIQWWQEESNLSMQILEFAFLNEEDDKNSCGINLVLFNSGNRDSALIEAELLHFTENKIDAGLSSRGTQYIAGSRRGVALDHVVRPGQISRVTLVFHSCTMQSLYWGIKRNRLRELKLKTVSIDHTGKRSSAFTNFAATKINPGEKAEIKLRLEGQFNLLNHG
ncbi:hypothetical protein [Stutzerimonas xanthomarina]|uniref:hypothetical protein n=1 Tax=Stutzerimonas xanthomarina TaxID=271420 RepID=UPI0029AE533D|nr:hypothetical protein [Stutzerimonas xanthomarina]MDX2355218.1 hypothetical protein [Stutzerimonas xanthomarina]